MYGSPSVGCIALTNSLLQMLRATHAPQEYMDAPRSYPCDSCAIVRKMPLGHNVSPPRLYECNHSVGVDVLELRDRTGSFYDVLNCFDHGAMFNQAWVVSVGDTTGTPPLVLQAVCRRVARMGPTGRVVQTHCLRPRCPRPRHLRVRRGRERLSNHTGRPQVSSADMSRREMPRPVFTKMAQKVVPETAAIGKSHMCMVLTETLNAVNEMSRLGGFVPCYRTLRRSPRHPASLADEDAQAHVGAIQGNVDGPAEFVIQASYKQQAREAYTGFDVGHRIARATLRKAAPVLGKYEVGDIVSFCRRPRNGVRGIFWIIGCRIVGFERGADDPP